MNGPGVRRWVGLAMGCVALALAGAPAARAAELDPSIVENPRTVNMERGSSKRWEALFEQNPGWIPRQLAYIEIHKNDLILSLLAARLLYRGAPWTHRDNDNTNAARWKATSSDVRLAILRALRWHREPVVFALLSTFLAGEDEPALVTSALIDMHLIDPGSTPAWALRLADPRHEAHLPGSANPTVRMRALDYLVETQGVQSPATLQALDWALLHTSGDERNHGIGAIPAKSAPALLGAVILALAAESRGGVLDDQGRLGLVLATSRISGNADRELVQALMDLTVHADRAVASTTASALATGVSWEVAVAVNDLADRASDPKQDPVVREALMSLLMRLYPSFVPDAAGPDSPWTDLAHHQERLQAWETERAVK
ncbi:MAG: hypothetical protein H0X38_12535 [Planctomycetes bacterium]|nr:hypothetical protein [Planctomycetota bacterium]